MVCTLMYQCLPTAPIESFYNNGVHQTNDPAIKEKLKPLSHRGVGIMPYGPVAEA